MALVRNKLLNPSDVPIVGAEVRFVLMDTTTKRMVHGMRDVVDANLDSTITPMLRTVTDSDGEWQVELVSNDLITTPAQTFYRVIEDGGSYDIFVPDEVGPLWVHDLRV